MGYLFWLALLVFVTMIAILFELAWGLKQMTHIKDVSIREQENMPKVSILVPACNEAQTVEFALTSILALEYPNLEIIVINDRSTDRTGDVLTGLQKKHPQLQVHHLANLPPGWLGKNHALHFASAHASGEYLLFTDADIVMEQSTLQRAMHHMLRHRLDHLSIFFENKAEGGLLNALFVDTGGALLLLFKPWKARDAKSRYYMGVGAFNLVKKSVYRAIGGHQKIAMHPIDDVMLGKVIKRQGFRQDCLSGYGFVSVQWYGTVRELIGGLMKNTFALYNYRVSLVMLSVILVFLLNILPLYGVFFTGGATRALFGSTILVRLLSFVHAASIAKISLWYAPFSLLSPYVSLYIVVKATVSTLVNGGITWRGTFYPLEKLKENRM